MPTVPNEKIKGKFYSQMPCGWIEKLQYPVGGHTFRVAMFIWYLKGWKRSSQDLVVSAKTVNEHYKIEKLALNRALHVLENLGMITVTRGSGKSPRVTILCEEYYESYQKLQSIEV
ncbi:MAG: hypothetical protein ACYDEF_08585 [Methanosarcina sp.]